MSRKNKRKKTEYRKELGFDPRKYISAPHSFLYYSPSDRTPHRGEVWFANLGSHPNSSVQGGCRPVIILSNNIGNAHADTVNIVPMTRHLKKPELPCHTKISPDDVTNKHQLFETSMVLAEQITTISKYALRNYAGRITDSGVLSRIEQSVAMQLGIETLIKKEEISCL